MHWQQLGNNKNIKPACIKRLRIIVSGQARQKKDILGCLFSVMLVSCKTRDIAICAENGISPITGHLNHSLFSILIAGL